MLTGMEQHLQAIVTVLSLVNPLICGVMFAQIETDQTRAVRIADATKAALAVLVILLVAALAGSIVLQIFGVSLEPAKVCRTGSGSPCCAVTLRRPEILRRMNTAENGPSRR